MLSLSKYERTLQPPGTVFQSLPFDKLRANGLKNEPLTCLLRLDQDGTG
ncbi:MAG: hypothetical protein LBD67_00565 [Candidatus Accumulibacter sp.]|nr:hypothetical protein [Accumulibacter sp.]